MNGKFRKHEDVLALIKSSKVSVLPSTREGFGIVVIEATACGIPVITINHKDNAARDLIEEEKNGFTCQLNEEEISKSIIRILNNSLSSKMKKFCMDLAQKYDQNKIFDEIEGVYLKMKMPELIKENNLKFTMRDLENKDMEYPSEVYINVNGEKQMIDKSSVLIKTTNIKQLQKTL